jgi:hypothetical protein
MLVGASLWDNKPWALSLIHGGDWFTKMLVMSAVITLTRRLALTPQLNDVPGRLRAKALSEGGSPGNAA